MRRTIKLSPARALEVLAELSAVIRLDGRERTFARHERQGALSLRRKLKRLTKRPA